MTKNESKLQISEAIRACLEKKAEEITILELEQGSGAFTDYFVVCSGSNPRQVQAIADEVEIRLKKSGMRPNQVEGYKQAEWGAARLCGFCGPRVLGKGPQVLRSGAVVEVGEALGAIRTGGHSRAKRAPVRALRKKRA